MSVAGGLARVAAQPGVLTVALGVDGQDVTARVTPDWSRDCGTLTAIVRFGPYAEPLRASQVLIYFEDDPPDVITLAGDLALPAGVPFIYDATVKIG